jgi:membrane protein
MAATMTALDRCYELRDGRPWFRQRFIAVLMTVVVATLILLVVLLLPVGGIVKAWVIRQNWPGFYRGAPWLVAFDIARWALAVLLLVSILTVLYHWGPYVRHRFHWLTPGAVFSIVVWVGLGLAFKLYLERFANYNKTYGTVGGAAVMLLMFYIDAAVLLWGAEINSEIDFEVLKVKRGTRNFIPAEEEVEGEFIGPLPTGAPPGDVPPASPSKG